MKNYHYTFILILIILLFITIYYIVEKVTTVFENSTPSPSLLKSPQISSITLSPSLLKSPQNSSITLSPSLFKEPQNSSITLSPSLLKNPQNPSPNNKSYSVTPFKIVNNTVDKQTTKPTIIVKQNSTYIEPEKFALEQNYEKFYNFNLNEFTSAELYSIRNAHIIFDPSDLIQRQVSSPILKSLLHEQDVRDVSQIVYYLVTQNKNNVGAYMTISSLEKDREDVNQLYLQKDIDYSTSSKRTLMSGEEYLPIGNPTPQYEALMQYRLSQIKRCGFTFVQLGVLDPLSIFNYTTDEYNVNPYVNLDEFRKFVFRILKYCKELGLKVCISEFPAMFTNYEKELVKYIHYIHVFNNDARSFKKPSSIFIKEFSSKPVFLSTVLCNNVIDNFIHNTGWSINSVLYEMSMFGNPLPTPYVPIKNIPKIKWCPYPKRWWKSIPPKLPAVTMLIPCPTNDMLYPHIEPKKI